MARIKQIMTGDRRPLSPAFLRLHKARLLFPIVVDLFAYTDDP
ncbi:hypothetical protein SAMN04487895_10956 [Paenibacillus sophorae]|uniref:Uncharacterized protein n=1 Tax=Paenibacillus sophorae TaxID=1333845 RepID=A0A1H8QZ40_9BACL|nr:hypothetical protein [Paenibacillus sophorae]SEO59138.1 hypothetical protein SAMN04487895_10956 [Paenibacillus sophorae]